MLPMGLCLTETWRQKPFSEGEIQSRIRNDIAGSLDKAFLPPFHLLCRETPTLRATPEGGDLCLPLWESLGTPVWQETPHQTGTRRVFSCDVQVNKNKRLVGLSPSPRFHMKKGVGVC